jgi:periplasmic protein CpxP/Spy
MKTIRSSYLASAAIIALLALPAAALAQPAQPPAPAAPPAQPPAPAAPPAAASSPMTSHPVPGKNMEERVESHIKELHAQLRITAAEEPQWDQFAQVMRENARDMDQAFTQRAQQYPTMNAVQNMQSYEQIGPGVRQPLQRDARAAEKADGSGVPRERGTARGTIASWRKRDSKMTPARAGAPAPFPHSLGRRRSPGRRAVALLLACG